MPNTSRLTTIICDKGKRISQSQYEQICENIDGDKFSLNEYVVEYKLRESIIGNMVFVLNDGTRILLNEDVVNTLNALQIDKTRLVEYMQQSEQNFKKVIREIING